MVAGCTFAWAWSDVSGTIRSINANTHEITLDDGKTYTTEQAVNIASLKVGDKVTITTQVENGKNVVNKVAKS
jgi:Cu/Ag efflux protein CusF